MATTVKTAHSELFSNRKTAAHRDKILVQVFHTNAYQGTRASVVIGDDKPDHNRAQDVSRLNDSEASCWVWSKETQLKATQLHVRCYNNGHPIRFCGHGLLAGIYGWQQKTAEQHSSATVISGGRRFIATFDDGGIWLHCPRICCQHTTEFPRHWFAIPPEQAARAGGKRGYWVFRWPPGQDLKCIGPDLNGIARETRCGVIATAAMNPSGSEVALRYFAPAYGQPEDSATGSAAVVLADYWGLPTLRLEQRSEKGALLKTRLSPTSVALSGTISVIEEAAGEANDG